MKVTVLLLALGAATMVAAAALASTEIGKSPGTAVGRTVLAGSDGPDIQIRPGTIIATATDYEMDGTMWTAFTVLDDSNTYIYRSTDHGLSWEYRTAFNWGSNLAERLELVVGEGDSAFVYLFTLHPSDNGDLVSIRIARDGSSQIAFAVAIGPDTIRDFAVCRDYTGSNYWLYAVVTTDDTAASSHATRFLRSSTYGREWYVTDSSRSHATDPHISAGAGSYIYFTCRSPFFPTGPIVVMVNRLWMNQGYWVSTSWHPDTLEEIDDPVIAAAFTQPESVATIWCLWNQNYQNSGDWDLYYRYSTDGGVNWSASAVLTNSTAAERFADIRNYTSPGNLYVNASYISEAGQDRAVVRRYASGLSPAVWSDPLRLNEGNAGTGREVRPKLCYTPGAPFTGAGAVFVGAGLNGAWWNAPYPVGAEEYRPTGAEIVRLRVSPAVGPGPFRVTGAANGDLLVRDGCGRAVRTVPRTDELIWDGRDAGGRRVSAGVYFLHVASTPQPVKVILTR
jgi:hypothetical protein